MMNRLFVITFVLIALLAVTSNPIVAADPPQSTGFDLNACYAHCPCSRGIMDHACAVCKQQCEWQSWRHQRDENINKKVK